MLEPINPRDVPGYFLNDFDFVDAFFAAELRSDKFLRERDGHGSFLAFVCAGQLFGKTRNEMARFDFHPEILLLGEAAGGGGEVC